MQVSFFSRSSARCRALPLFDVSIFVLAGLLALGAVDSYVAHRRAVRRFAPALIVPTEARFKANLIERLAKPPQLIFFGGSRSERFDPRYARRKTGLRSFNLAITNSRPEVAWGFANWLYARAPRTKLHWVWGIQKSTFYDRDLDPTLVQDQRFSWYFPDSLLKAERKHLPHNVAQMPRHSPLEHRRYASDGLLLWNAYDSYEAHGRTLKESLREYIRKEIEKQREETAQADRPTRARAYFEKTLGLLNQHGTTPVIVLMPVHPKVLAAIRPYGSQERHARFLAYFRELHKKYRFDLVDLTEIASFHGDPKQFYDGVHIKRLNANRVIDELVRRAPGAFK